MTIVRSDHSATEPGNTVRLMRQAKRMERQFSGELALDGLLLLLLAVYEQIFHIIEEFGLTYLVFFASNFWIGQLIVDAWQFEITGNSLEFSDRWT